VIWWLLIALLVTALAGLLLASYLTWVSVRVERGEPVKCLDDTCPIVMQTPDARLAGFPNFCFAIPFYLVLVLFAALRMIDRAAWLFGPVAAASLLSLAASAWLTYSLLAKLKRP
jgi:uncharacterized membrane protein